MNLLLLVPDYLAQDYGQDTYLVEDIEADNPEAIVKKAQQRAAEDYEENSSPGQYVNANDFLVLLAFKGEVCFHAQN